MSEQSYAESEISVVVPTLNAQHFLADCLKAVRDASPAEVIVVDGGSDDKTPDIARDFGATVVVASTLGPAAARNIGVQNAEYPLVFLVDSDVVVKPNTLDRLRRELVERGLDAIQARLASTSSGPGYWGRALALHHRLGKADNEWFGFAATLARRDLLLAHPFDDALPHGEDLELARRLERAGARARVSTETAVVHRLGDTFASARQQWLDDGIGIAAVVEVEGRRAAWMVVLPAAAGIRGIALSAFRMQPRWVLYYVGLMVFNVVGMIKGFAPQGIKRLRTAAVGLGKR